MECPGPVWFGLHNLNSSVRFGFSLLCPAQVMDSFQAMDSLMIAPFNDSMP